MLRACWAFGSFHVTMAVAGNYYPLASPGMIRIQEQPSAQADGPRMLSVLTDRAHGASSLSKGWLEIMVSGTTYRRHHLHVFRSWLV